ncbi:MAG TPA: epimerase, partial [Micromonosporaceae bacterium]|nr:epimerase [Micromonosporaceae bacterium]
MVGQGVLRECLLDPEVSSVVSVGRTALKEKHDKLRDIVHPDLLDLSPIDLSGFDACFFCLGITSAGMNEADYRRITHDMTMAAARPLSEANPDMTFIYVSGAGTDSTERGRSMWARVKGQTENELLALPFRAYMFRPGVIQPLHGITSNTRLYRILYRVSGPVIPLLRKLFP